MSMDMSLPWAKLNVEVLVIGDVMLDEYIDGQVKRVSPEAPVPVHSVQDRWFSAGGAANVARNIKLAGVRHGSVLSSVTIRPRNI